jgi:glutaredoxin
LWVLLQNCEIKFLKERDSFMANRYIIYGRSTCSYCVKAVDLLESRGEESIFFDFFDDPDALTDAKRFYKMDTVPIIIQNNKIFGKTTLIGGYSELTELFND